MRRRMVVFYVNLGTAARGPGVAVNVVVDDSASMTGDAIAKVREAVESFLAEAPERTRIGLLGFGEGVHVYSPPTEHREFLEGQVHRFQARGGATRLFDAVGQACEQFAEDGRHRHVLVLTDGGDNASERFAPRAAPGKIGLGAFAREKRVRVSVVGFGDVQRAVLEPLAAETGGKFLLAPGPDELPGHLSDLLEWIEADRRELRLRPEFERLLDRSSARGDWLFQVSLEESGGDAAQWDGENLRFPPPPSGATSTRAYRDHFSRVVAEPLRREVKNLVEKPARRGMPSAPDLDVFVVGRVEDPAFRAFSPAIAEVMRGLAPDVVAFHGNHYVTFVPLVRALGEKSRGVRVECYEWLTAALNSGGHRVPNAVLSLADANWHRSHNPTGFVSAVDSDMAAQAANVLWSLAIDAARVVRMTEPPSAGGWPIWSAGAVTVNVGPGPRVARDALEALGRAVRGLGERQATAGGPEQESARIFGSERVEIDALKEELLAPIGGQSPEGTLAAIHISPDRFWPAREMPEEDYLPALSTWIEQKGSEYLSRKIAALRHALALRASRRLSALKAAVMRETDRLLFGRDDASLSVARELLARLAARADVEKQRIGGLGGGPLLQSLFPEAAAASGGDPTAAAARARQWLENTIASRPRWEGLALKHGFLALAAGLLSARLAALVPRLLIDLGPFQLPTLVGLLVGGGTVVAGALRWLAARARLARAVRDYVAALVGVARARALQETLEALRGFYDDFRGWIGEVDSVPPWKPSEARTENALTQRHLLAELGSHLERSLEALRRWLDDNPAIENPFVWEPGDRVPCRDDEAASPSIPSPRMESLSLPWSALAPLAANASWREVGRRKACDTLDEYLAFNKERLALPARLWERAEERVRDAYRRQGSVGLVLSQNPPSSADIEWILRCMRSRSFPPIEGLESAKPDGEWLGHREEARPVLQRAAQGERKPLQELLAWPVVHVDDPWALSLFQVTSARVADCPDWARCRSEWQALPVDERRERLAQWGDPAQWRDPADGQPVVPSVAENAAGPDEGEGL